MTKIDEMPRWQMAATHIVDANKRIGFAWFRRRKGNKRETAFGQIGDPRVVRSLARHDDAVTTLTVDQISVCLGFRNPRLRRAQHKVEPQLGKA